MSQVQQLVALDEHVWDVAQAVAVRRGVDTSIVIEEALRRFVAADDLGALFDELRQRDVDPLSDEESMAMAIEELAAARAERSA